MQQPSHESLCEAIVERANMRRAVTTRPADEWFPRARELLDHAMAPNEQREHLLIVMRQVRLEVERHARDHSVPPVLTVGFTGSEKLRPFEYELVHNYLPDYLARVRQRDTHVCLRRHARTAYRQALDDRMRQEPFAEAAVPVVATQLSSWVPSPAEVRASLGAIQELERMLDPFDYQIAELLMKYRIVHRDKGELAVLLSTSEGRSISRERVAHAIHNIRSAVEQIRGRRR